MLQVSCSPQLRGWRAVRSNLPQAVFFRVLNTVSVGTLQFAVDFDSAVSSLVDCFALPAGGSESLVAFNLSVGPRGLRLNVGVISIAGLDGPTDAVSCRFAAAKQLQEGDFSVTVLDANDLHGMPVDGIQMGPRLVTSGAQQRVAP